MSRDGWATLPRDATGLSAVCDCGISRSYSLTNPDHTHLLIFKSSSKIFLRNVRRRYFFCGSFVLFMSCVCSQLPCGHLLGKDWPLGSCLWCLIAFLSLSHTSYSVIVSYPLVALCRMIVTLLYSSVFFFFFVDGVPTFVFATWVNEWVYYFNF